MTKQPNATYSSWVALYTPNLSNIIEGTIRSLPSPPPPDANTVNLKQQLENLSTRVFEVREEDYKKGEAKIA